MMNPTTTMAAPAPPMPTGFMPPGGPIEIAFSFDTTGSMSECLDRVRGQLNEVIQRLTADIPGLRIAVIAHGDYCDEQMFGYITKHVDFTNDVGELCRFVGEVGGTGGGDLEECYELVLNQARELLSWQPGTQRALVVIGDAMPHEPCSEENKSKLDWRLETQRLVDHGVHIYAVQCLNNPEADSFYQHLAATPGGNHLKLDEFHSIVDMIMAICYREKGAEFFEAYEMEVRQRDGSAIRADLDRMFASLRDREEAGPSAACSYSDVTPNDNENDDDDDDDGDYETPRTSRYNDTAGPMVTPPPAVPMLPNAAVNVTRPRSGSVSSVGSVASGASATSSRSSRSRRSTGSMFTRSQAHPMNLRRREVREITEKNRRRSRHAKKTPSQKTYEKVILRERMRGDTFPLADLEWTRWQQAMSPSKSDRKNFQNRPRGRVGERRRRLFDGDLSIPAVYEVAVQPPDSQTKTPVFGKITGGFRRHWEPSLFSPVHLGVSVQDVLTKGCKLYVRRATIIKKEDASVESATTTNVDLPETMAELKGLMSQCDYAWNARLNNTRTKRVHRDLVRKGVHISQRD